MFIIKCCSGCKTFLQRCKLVVDVHIFLLLANYFWVICMEIGVGENIFFGSMRCSYGKIYFGNVISPYGSVKVCAKKILLSLIVSK